MPAAFRWKTVNLSVVIAIVTALSFAAGSLSVGAQEPLSIVGSYPLSGLSGGSIMSRSPWLRSSSGKIVFRFHARDLHLVLGPTQMENPFAFA